MMKIDAKYLTKVYKNSVYGLKNCTFSTNSGEFLVVLGASGSGKSTLLKVLAGTSELSSGELYFDGILSDNLTVQKRDVSMVFQEYLLYPHMTVFDNLATPLKQAREDEKAIYDRVMEALRVFGLEIVADVKPKCLSGGEQQRVALAKALLKRSRLVLLDEPMSNVDEKSRWDYCCALKNVKQMLPDSTCIYVTHNTKEAMLLADRIAVMRDGAILQIAPKDLLLKYPKHLEVMEILGDVGITLGATFDGEAFVFDDDDFSDVELPIIDTSGLLKGQRVTVVRSRSDDESYHVFDEYGRSISLPTEEFTLCGSLDEETLNFAEQNIALGEEYLSRLLCRPAEIGVGVSIDKLSKTALSNSIPLVFEVSENLGDHVILKIQDKSFVFYGKTGLKTGERIRLYYRIEDMIFYNTGERLTCHYPLHRRVRIRVLDARGGRIELLGKRIRLNKSISVNVKYARITDSAFELSYSRGKCSVPVAGCLDEEFINGKKLNHIAVKDADEYLSIISGEDICCFGKEHVWLNITPSHLIFE